MRLGSEEGGQRNKKQSTSVTKTGVERSQRCVLDGGSGRNRQNVKTCFLPATHLSKKLAAKSRISSGESKISSNPSSASSRVRHS